MKWPKFISDWKQNRALINATADKLEPDQLESYLIAKAFIRGFYIFMIIIMLVVATPHYWAAQIPMSGMMSLLQWLMVPLSAIIGALLTRWKGVNKIKEEEDRPPKSDE